MDKDNMESSMDSKKSMGKDAGNTSSITSVDVQNFLKKLNFPAKKQEIIEEAMKEGADNKVRGLLQLIPEKYYSSTAELTRELAEVI